MFYGKTSGFRFLVYFYEVIKSINIFFLLIFIQFLSLPTLLVAVGEDLTYELISVQEEEETQKKSSVPSFSEEEVKGTFPSFFHNILNRILHESVFFFDWTQLKTDVLAFKIPLPPPEYI